MPAKTAIDIDGSEAISAVLLKLLNEFPGLSPRQRVQFATLEDTGGIGFFPSAGAAIETEKESITGHVQQRCLYPFEVFYRSAPKTEAQRLRIKEFLDTLGKWLERQPVKVNGKKEQLAAYPALASGNRLIKSISRAAPACPATAYQDGVEDWAMGLRLTYENDFYR